MEEKLEEEEFRDKLRVTIKKNKKHRMKLPKYLDMIRESRELQKEDIERSLVQSKLEIGTGSRRSKSVKIPKKSLNERLKLIEEQ